MSNSHKFRTEIPNIVFELGLSIYEIAVYVAIKKIAGDDGKCIASVKTISKNAKISERKALYCINKLKEKVESIQSPLILVQQRKTPQGDKDTNCISICNIWEINENYFNPKKNKQKSDKKNGPGVVHNVRGVVHMVRDGGAPHAPGGGAHGAYKEDPCFKEDPYVRKQQHHQTSSAGADPVFDGAAAAAAAAAGTDNLFLKPEDLFSSLQVKHPQFPASVIREAVQEVFQCRVPVVNPMRYAEVICERMINQPRLPPVPKKEKKLPYHHYPSGVQKCPDDAPVSRLTEEQIQNLLKGKKQC